MLNVKLSTNANEIEAILKHPDIYKTISGDNSVPIDEFSITGMTSVLFLMVYDDKVPIGVTMYHKISQVEYGCHFQIIPKFRKAYAKKAGLISLEWFWKSMKPSIIKLTAEVPTLYPNVIKFGLFCGFKIEGTNTKSFVLNQKIYDQIYLGCIRPGIE